MQMLVEIIKRLWEKPWFIEILIILFFASVMLWNKVTGTERYLRWRVKKSPNDFDAHMNLAFYLAEFDDSYEEAEKEFRTAISLKRNDPHPFLHLFFLKNKLENISEAEEIVNEAIKLFPEIGDFYFRKAWLLRKIDKQVSEGCFLKAIELDPKNYYRYEWYARF